VFLEPAINGMQIPVPKGDDEWGRWGFSNYWGITFALMFYAEIFIILLECGAVGVQVRETKSRLTPGSLSVDGLFVQAVMFLVLGVSMVFRMKLPDSRWEFPDTPSLPPEKSETVVKLEDLIMDWLLGVAWAMIHPLVLALTHGILWRICRRKCQVMETGEREPLLEQR
jgi:hypothetical protein